MSLHYLIDPFTNTGDIIDVTTAENGQTDATGATIIRVPDGVAIHNNPSNLADLITEKYDGLLASYAGFQELLADACQDGLTVDPTSFGVLLSSGFVNHCLLPGGLFTSTVIPLAFTPTQAVLLWEEFSFTDADTLTGRTTRTYVEGSGAQLGGAVTFGVGLNATTNGTVLNIPVLNQGGTAQVVFSNGTADRVYLGSWALIY